MSSTSLGKHADVGSSKGNGREGLFWIVGFTYVRIN